MCRFDNVRRVLRNILRCIPKVSTVAVLLFAHLLVFSFIGNTFLRHFSETEWGKLHCEVLPYNFSRAPDPNCTVGTQLREDYFGPSRLCGTLFQTSNALYCTATVRILIPAECSALL